MRLFGKKKKRKPTPPAPKTPTGIPLAPIHKSEPDPPDARIHQVPLYTAPQPRFEPQPPPDYLPPAMRAQTPDYEQYDIGNAEYASRLRSEFSLTGPSRFALASEIVPVAAFVVGSEESTGTRFHASASITPAAGQFPMVRVTHQGSSGRIILDRIRIVHVNQVALTASRPALTADNAVTVSQLEQGDTSSAIVRAQSAGGGLVATDTLQFSGEEDTGTPWQELGLEIYPGSDILIFGSSVAAFLGVHIYGRVVP